MSLRLIEVCLPDENAQQVPELLQEYSLVETWTVQLADHHHSLVKILLLAKEAEAVLDLLENHFFHTDGFRIILIAVEVSIPRPELSKEASFEADPLPPEEESPLKVFRINRQELYEDVTHTVELTSTHLLMVLLSTIIAAIGLIQNNQAIIIGAVVIAPLIGPNMALSLATTLGDTMLALRAIKMIAAGTGIALVISVLIGLLVGVNPEGPEVALRTHVQLSDIILAFASGVAGALSLTSGITSAIVGVLVAVALLPPLVTFGMLLGSGDSQAAVGALLLLLTNLICLNLAGIGTFLVQEIRPAKWWEIYQAKKVANLAFGLWLVLLLAVMLGIFVWRQNY